jgi:hypothetical protein
MLSVVLLEQAPIFKNILDRKSVQSGNDSYEKFFKNSFFKANFISTHLSLISVSYFFYFPRLVSLLSQDEKRFIPFREKAWTATNF